MTPARGAAAFSTALLTSSRQLTLPQKAWTEHPWTLSSRKKFRSPSDFPAEGDRKMRFRAPRSTSQVETALPRPPRPPTRRYAASGRRWSSCLTAVTPSSCGFLGIVTTILPICWPFCMYLKASNIRVASKTSIGLIGSVAPCR
jgi:hypothetical protein